MPAQPFVSYAQNGEDIVLWRALGHVRRGTYVDVGAADPVLDSVTKAFYERGWQGVNVEPVPEYAEALRRDRPRDRTFAEAAGRESGTVTLFVVPGTGLSTAMAADEDRAHLADHEVEEVPVPVRPLDDLLADAGIEGDIHFCKIDVEGLEADVLAGFDLRRWRPWVLVIESTRPNGREQTHEAWEPLVLEQGYEFCLFDGLNRFYVAEEHGELREALSAPANVLDQPYIRYLDQRQLDELTAQVEHLHALASEEAAGRAAAAEELHALHTELSWWRTRAADLGKDLLQWRERALKYREGFAAAQSQLIDVRRELDATLGTVSWKVTTPLRAVRKSMGVAKELAAKERAAVARRAGRRTSSTVELPAPLTVKQPPPPPEPGPKVKPPDARELPWSPAAAALARRLDTVIALLDPSAAGAPRDLPHAMAAFEDALERSDLDHPALAWISLVAAHATYPTEHDFNRALHVLELEGRRGLASQLWEDVEAALSDGRARDRDLEVVTDGVIVDVTHTASHDLHTGVQRVVRETVPRWLANHQARLVAWDWAGGALAALQPDEVERFLSWRRHVHGSNFEPRSPLTGDEPVIVPWRTKVLLPEIAGEWIRTDRYRALLRSGVSAGLSAIVYDLIPININETVVDGMAEVFADYLGLLKYADALSAISQTSAQEFAGWAAGLAGQGLTGPTIVGQPLAAEPLATTEEDLAAARTDLGLDGSPMVLVIGSHEPRKNHMAVLLAAERLWREGHVFHLVFIGGSAWKSEGFTSWANLLASAGRPLQIVRRASEERLWAACRLARFTMFPSLAEGFGLPVVESLVCGTPAITSDFGSMAEIGEGGGVLMVNPRDPDAITAAMRDLLVDDELLERLRKEAANRAWKTWAEYSEETWQLLTGGRP